jgi:hypothetical protein
MSLYHVLFGQSDDSEKLLAVLASAGSIDPPRFRDCYFDGTDIVVHTRTGGGNRDYYEDLKTCRENYPEYFKDRNEENWPTGPWNADMYAHPWFSRDEDSEFDPTYANFYFRPPKAVAAILSTT